MKVDDEYAKKHMAGEGDVLYFDKRTMPRWLRTMMGATLAGGASVVVGAGVGSGDARVLLLLPIYAFAALAQVSFWTLRTAVTRQNVHIQYGLWGPKIATQSIIKAEVIHYDWKTFGGWGIRRGLRDGAVAYNMMGDQGKAVKIAFQEDGKTRHVIVSASHPEQLCGAILEAMGGASLADVRDGLGVKDVVVAEEVEADAEVEVLLKPR